MTQRTTSILVRLGPLFALLVFALIPYGWIAENNPAFGRFANWLFATEAAHAVGHSLIFAGIGSALLACFPALLRQPWRYVGLILLIGVAQEGLQLAYKGRGVILNDLTDLAIDLLAACVVYAIAHAIVRRRGGNGDSAQ